MGWQAQIGASVGLVHFAIPQCGGYYPVRLLTCSRLGEYVRYLATAAAVAESSERGGGDAGMTDARSAAVGGAVAEAARKRKAAYGIPPRPSSAAHVRPCAAASVRAAGEPRAQQPPIAPKRHKGCAAGERSAAIGGGCSDSTPAVVTGDRNAASLALGASSSKQADGRDADGSLSDGEDTLMLVEDELNFAAVSQAADAHQHAVLVVKRLGT